MREYIRFPLNRPLAFWDEGPLLENACALGALHKASASCFGSKQEDLRGESARVRCELVKEFCGCE